MQSRIHHPNCVSTARVKKRSPATEADVMGAVQRFLCDEILRHEGGAWLHLTGQYTDGFPATTGSGFVPSSLCKHSFAYILSSIFCNTESTLGDVTKHDQVVRIQQPLTNCVGQILGY
jgi:hypothetical protein